jgi:hypothetical protein
MHREAAVATMRVAAARCGPGRRDFDLNRPDGRFPAVEREDCSSHSDQSDSKPTPATRR